MNTKTFTKDLLASLVVFLVALPLCMGIAIASGVPPAMGLVAGIIGGLVVGPIAGSPLQVSGPAAGLVVLVFEIVQEHGLGGLAVAVMIAGALQVGAGALRIGRWFRAVSPAVIYGMLSGIGVLIFSSQVHVMVDDKPVANGLINLASIPSAIEKGLIPLDGTVHHLAAWIGMATLVTLVVWNVLKSRMPGPLSMIPAPLLAVGVAVGLAQAAALPINYVAVPTEISGLFHFPTAEYLGHLVNPALFGEAVALAIIASAESLLCAAAVDKLHDGVRSDLDRELMAQGAGNLVSGFVGGLPITGVIVRSSANVEAGGTSRASAILHGIWLLGFLVLAPWALALIPTSALGAVLVYIGYKLVNPATIRNMWTKGRAEFAIYATTVLAIIATNLLEGLMVGLVLAVGRVAWQLSTIHVRTERAGKRIDVHLDGAGTFVSLPTLSTELEALPVDAEVHVHLEDLLYVDHACVDWLAEWKQQRKGVVVLEMDTLTELRARTKPKKVNAA